jgi:hypothetical protein
MSANISPSPGGSGVENEAGGWRKDEVPRGNRAAEVPNREVKAATSETSDADRVLDRQSQEALREVLQERPIASLGVSVLVESVFGTENWSISRNEGGTAWFDAPVVTRARGPMWRRLP